jgi:hypothetical protein
VLGEHAERHQYDAAPAYPELRPVPGPHPGFVPEVLWRVEGLNAEQTLGDTNADVFTASGTPDKWRVVSRTAGAMVVLTNILDQEEVGIPVQAGEAVELYVPRRKLRARNLLAGANAVISVAAFFTGPVFSFDAR